jgi:hypothetical protein
LNGVLGPYFSCKRGVRQGDPLSPFLFILVADVLNKILSNAKLGGYVDGLGNFSNMDYIMNLHFADDTLLFLKADSAVLTHIKWLLVAFENVSGLKINYEKSEMYALNLSDTECASLASVIGCKVAQLPLKYLGVPINNKSLTDIDWQPLLDKIEKRLQSWKGSLLSLGGRVTLLNSVLSAIPMYWMSVYRLPAKIRHKIDKIRRKFLWHGGNSTRKKYPLVSWDVVCRSKDQGGLGIIDLKLMNKSLLAKWWIRFLDPSVQGKWKDILRSKYGTSTGPSICSPFWRSILKDRPIIDLGLNKNIGNGKSTAFWLDRWHSEIALQHLYPNLFSICTDRFISVAQVFSVTNLALQFRRQLTGVYKTEWQILKSQFLHFTLSQDMVDRLIWRWSSDSNFTVHSFYKWLEYGGVPNKEFQTIWKSHIPLKIKIFLWLVKQNKILTKANLMIRGWNGDLTCVFCNQVETVDHLFVQCSYIKAIWNWIATFNNFSFDCECLDDLWLLDAVIPLKDRLLLELLRGAVLWSIWLERNRVCFNVTRPVSLKVLGAKIISLASYWCQAKSNNSFLKLSLMLPSDVKELPEQISEELASSPNTGEVIELLLSLTQDGSQEEIQDSGSGSPMSGDGQQDDDSIDWDHLD